MHVRKTSAAISTVSVARDRLRLMIGLTIDLAKIVEGAGVLFIARTASTDDGHTGAVG